MLVPSVREAPWQLEPSNLADYLRARRLVRRGEGVEVHELGGGISNAVLGYRSARACGVVKQARGRIRVADEWYCDVRRIFNDRDAMRLLGRILPEGTVPSVIDADDENFAYTMTCAPEAAVLWKPLLLDGIVGEGLAATAGRLLAIVHGASRSDAALEARFVDLELLGQVRIDPYYDTTAARNPDVAQEIQDAAKRLQTERRALVLGDYIPKNLFALGDSDLFIVDFEIAHYGEPAYDTASFANHLLLKAIRRPMWQDRYRQALDAFWSAYSAGLPPAERPIVERETIRQLGCLMLARIDGKSPVEYLKSDSRETARVCAKSLLTRPPVAVPDAVTRVLSILNATDSTPTSEEPVDV